MKIIFITSLLLCISFTIKAQNISYEKLDSISAAISQYQMESNNLIYNDGSHDYKLSFPENNFQILYSTGKATKAVKKEMENVEYLYLTEDIDLTEAREIYPALYPGIAGVLRVSFPDGVKTQIYTDGKYTKTVTEYYLEFFFNRNSKLAYADQELLSQLANTIGFFKLENNLPANQFLFEGGLNRGKYGAKVQKNYVNYWNTLYDKAEYYLDKAASGGLNHGISHSLAASYLLDALSIKIPYTHSGISRITSSLLYHLDGAGDYSKIGEIINSPNAYFLNLTESKFVSYKASYLQGIGKCLEAERFLLDIYNSSRTSIDLKQSVSTQLYFLYQDGCRGEKDNKVKKNKALANQYKN